MLDSIYAVIDTNVLVSALFSLKSETKPAQIIRKVIDGTIIPIYNDEIIAEYSEVLHRDKFPFKESDIALVLGLFRKYGLKLDRTTADEVFIDKDDIVFYEVTLTKEESYLITGNKKHFPRKSFVVTPAEMLEIITLQETRSDKYLNDPAARYCSSRHETIYR